MRHYDPSYSHRNQLLMSNSGPIWRAAAVFLFLLCHHLTCEVKLHFLCKLNETFEVHFIFLLPIAMSLIQHDF